MISPIRRVAQIFSMKAYDSSVDFATASDATFQADPAELLRGRLRGSVSVSDLVLRLVRNPDGAWNVERLALRKRQRRHDNP